MNRIMARTCAATLVAMAIAPGAFALPTLTITRVANHGANAGGEFTVSGTPFASAYQLPADSTVGAGTFQTFCLEYNEYISLGGTYQYTVDTGAIQGGVAGGNPDTLSVGTAWLYRRFALGTLSGYNYTTITAGNTGNRNESANFLQNAIWWLEQEVSLSAANLAANPFLSQVATEFGSLTAARADAAAGSVRVLNLQDAQGRPQQSQVVYIPDGGLTMLMLGASLAGFAAIRRRMA